MTIRRAIEVVVFCVTLLVAAMALHAWLASRDEQQRLATTLSQQKQLLDAADTREHTRQSALDDTLAQIGKLKRATQTPQQILDALPNYLSLPQPITLAPAPAQQAQREGTGASAKSPIPGSSSPVQPSTPSASLALPSAPTAQIPSADLKPLYDYIQDCRACQAQLAAAKQTTSDDDAKITALTAERDAAVTAAKGGTFWRRLRRNALWFGIGTALGGAATYRAGRNGGHSWQNFASTSQITPGSASLPSSFHLTSANEYYVPSIALAAISQTDVCCCEHKQLFGL